MIIRSQCKDNAEYEEMLLTWFAGQAMQEIVGMSGPKQLGEISDGTLGFARGAVAAYVIAAAMLAEKRKREQK